MRINYAYRRSLFVSRLRQAWARFLQAERPDADLYRPSRLFLN